LQCYTKVSRTSKVFISGPKGRKGELWLKTCVHTIESFGRRRNKAENLNKMFVGIKYNSKWTNELLGFKKENES
jgi:hypothetical protein